MEVKISGGKMKHKSVILALISTIVLIVAAEGSNRTFKVLFVVVPTSETELVSQARSYIGRELRGLRDVEMVEKDPSLEHFFISICPLSLKLSSGITSGVVVSYVFEKDGIIHHNVLIGGPNELKTLCEKIIAYFDTYCLEPERKKQK
jgi:hypothetical protein